MKLPAQATSGAQPQGYLRRNGFPLGLLVASVTIFLTPYFWSCVGLFALAVLISAIDVWKEVVVPKHNQTSKIVFITVSVTAVGLFCFWLFRPVPLMLTASSSVPRYGPGTNIDGIPWSNSYAELRFTLTNTSSVDLDNLDVEVSTDLMIEALKEIDGLASCIIAPSGQTFLAIHQRFVGSKPVGPNKMEEGEPVGPAVTNDPNYKIAAVDEQGRIIGFSGGTSRIYRIRCDKFPAKSRSNFIAALSVLNAHVGGKPPNSLYSEPRVAAWCTAKAKFSTLGRPRSADILVCKMGQDCKS